MAVRNLQRNLNRPLTDKELRFIERGEALRLPSFKNKPKAAPRRCLWCRKQFEVWFEQYKPNMQFCGYLTLRHDDVLPMLEYHVMVEHLGYSAEDVSRRRQRPPQKNPWATEKITP